MVTPYERAIEAFKYKKILIFGLGLLGGAVGDARFFAGIGSQVRVTDMKSSTELASSLNLLKEFPITTSLGGHRIEDIEWADIIVRNPSIPINHPLLEAARHYHKKIVMRSSLFVELAGIPTIGITGTRGKTTTTMMIYDLLRQLTSHQVLLGGNVKGISDLELLRQITDPNNTMAVLELSSWQLQGFAENLISPHIAVVTNLYPDHLNVYSDLNSYYADKQAIFSYQHPNDYVVLNQLQPEFREWATKARGHVIWFSPNETPSTLCLKIPGEHNRANAAAVLAVAEIMKLPADMSVSRLNKFDSVPYRLQTVREVRGITFINDTTATTPTAAIAALNSMAKNSILICGGADKKLPLEQLAQVINQQTKKVIFLQGNGTDRLKPLIDMTKIKGQVSSMDAAVNQAFALAEPGDIILLSPGFASFGLFNNEFDRGDQFNQCVQKLP